VGRLANRSHQGITNWLGEGFAPLHQECDLSLGKNLAIVENVIDLAGWAMPTLPNSALTLSPSPARGEGL